MSGILGTIIAAKRLEVSGKRKKVPLQQMIAWAASAPKARSLAAALRPVDIPNNGKPKLIAEIKRRSPSAGIIAENIDVASIVRTYERAGAAAISVITDEQFFGGSITDLTTAREVTSLPILRKDFIVDSYQIFEARRAGADAILVIVAASAEERDISHFIAEAKNLGMDAIVEVHDHDELTLAVRCGARMIGINNRDLRTFKVDLAVTAKLTALVPENIIVISESGIHTGNDVRKVYESGADAILVGEALLAHRADPAKKIRELMM